MRARASRTISASMIAVVAFGAISASHAESTVSRTMCGTSADYFVRVKDYRQRDSTETLKGAFADNWEHHTGRAIKGIASGRLNQLVMVDLDFTLRRWPNHRDALRALAQYSIAGGKSYGMLPVDCYFLFAAQFAPDDAAVPLIEGSWRWRKGDKEEAVRAYRRAIEIDPLYAEAHYNLGLAYVELGRIDDAREHARIAYERGFPLPGLQQKLNDQERVQRQRQ